ncbi:probable LRR receptor-like serine/threonine-protein kinase At3g47570 isoform X2 [Rosa chinensis]|uniref:probable LRR receptor-like serine/threonine-protein kinase At3g47570 isoform X2 n=1 Tax=Rosa chinensis TaxID=74649 RepID=UPI000D0889D9|nr:probable LRR receptor-like serine/threonine-protein kinase At3g47570 isoform X2 [Rosa chinensis]
MELHEQKLCAFWFKSLHVITHLLLVMNFFLPTTIARSFGNETDRIALLKFKESIASDPHGLLNSWNDSLHFCNWHGISCGSRHQRVVALNLSHSDLHGTISRYTGNLSFLRSIDLGNNSFSGNIPQQLDHLFRLRYLNVSHNMMERGIPVNLTSCPELSHIDLWSNRLTGTIPPDLGSLMKLVLIGLEYNKLTGGIPPSLGNLSSIRMLGLTSNNLVGNVPEEIGRLRSLSYFAVGDNKLSGMIPPSLFNISSMESFSLGYNNLQGSIPPAIGLDMPHLLEMFVGRNELFGQIPSSFSNASLFRSLDIGRNNFVGQVPKCFGELPDLQWLDASNNNLGSFSANDLDFITSLVNCSKLDTLDMGDNNFGGVLPNSVANLSTQLTGLFFGGNQISGVIPETLENLNSLIALGLEENLFRGAIRTSIAKLQKLQFLALTGNRFSGRIPSSIGNLTQLYHLDLSGNDLEGNIPPSIGNCQYLQELNISNNRLSGDIPLQVIGLSSLVSLYLSQNSLTGSLPMEVGKLKNIYVLDISENNFTGEIPEVIGGCLSLELLFLQGNLFQEGEVPRGGAFRNKSATSLVGNSKLCVDGISEFQLPACPIRKKRKFKLKFTILLVAGCSLVLAVLLTLYWRRKLRKKPLALDSSINFLPEVSYKTLHQATGGFSPSTLIGSGGFGSVYKGILDQVENSVVAIKVINLQQRGASKSFTAECNALRNIRHRNLVKIFTCCSSMDYNGTEFKALVFEYMSNGSLEEWLHRENRSMSLTLLQRLNIVVDVASALCYLHDHCEPPIIHCDMKPSNVLLDDNMVAHVGDFGLARLISTTTVSSQTQSSTIGIKGTIGYAAPEYASGVEASRQGDVYSYGILVLEMFSGRRPTDEMFKDGLKLHDFVKMALPGRLVQIVDAALLATLEETAPTATAGNEVNYMRRGHNNEIEAEEENRDYENLSKMDTRVWKCIHSIFEIGLACSEESPKNRMCMEDVLRDLHRIQIAYIGVVINRERTRR